MSSLVPDVPTVYLMTGISSVAGAAMLLALRGEHGRADRSMPVFAAAILAMGLGFTFFALRAGWTGTVSALLGYVAFAVSAPLVWHGTTLLFGRPRPIWPAVAAVLAYVGTMVVLREANAQQAIARIMLSSLFTLAFLALAAWEIHRSPLTRSLRSARLMRALLVVFCTVIALRMSLFVANGIVLNSDGTATPGLARALFAMTFCSIPFMLTVSVLCIANGQLGARLRKLVATDELTRLVSRRVLHEAGPRLLERTDECIALLMIDLDDFKRVNDLYGHGVGDEVLRHVAGLLRGALRSDSMIVRYGGDEFCALVPVPGESAAFGVAERLRATVEASPYRHGTTALPVTMSVGVSVHRHGRTLREMLEEADRRAYHAKSQGRNRVVADDLLAAA